MAGCFQCADNIVGVMRGLDPRIHDDLQRGKALRKIVIDESHHGLPSHARQ
jgi:hypothetical protein